MTVTDSQTKSPPPFICLVALVQFKIPEKSPHVNSFPGQTSLNFSLCINTNYRTCGSFSAHIVYVFFLICRGGRRGSTKTGRRNACHCNCLIADLDFAQSHCFLALAHTHTYTHKLVRGNKFGSCTDGGGYPHTNSVKLTHSRFFLYPSHTVRSITSSTAYV